MCRANVEDKIFFYTQVGVLQGLNEDLSELRTSFEKKLFLPTLQQSVSFEADWLFQFLKK